jgi:ParB/RepB/Spo0J family partition protein
MHIHKQVYEFRSIDIEQVHPDVNQPRKDVRDDADRAKLVLSIRVYGIEIPLSVVKTGDDEYTIIDGHRRYFSAKEIGHDKVPCRIYDTMPKGELESRRFEMQNNRKNWKPLERAWSLERVKELVGLKTNRQLADHLHISETNAANSLQLKKEHMGYLETMAKYNLKESFQVEFMRLKPKLRKIRDLEVDDIIGVIFKKVDNKVISSSREFRTLGSIFLRATANEEALYEFLIDPDKNIEELERRTGRTKLLLLGEDLIQEITAKTSQGTPFTPQDEVILKELSKLLNQILD